MDGGKNLGLVPSQDAIMNNDRYAPITLPPEIVEDDESPTTTEEDNFDSIKYVTYGPEDEAGSPRQEFSDSPFFMNERFQKLSDELVLFDNRKKTPAMLAQYKAYSSLLNDFLGKSSSPNLSFY